jgi:hypothetical protein
MAAELITYKKFNDIGLANQLAGVLEEYNVIYRIEEESTLFNPAFNTDERATHRPCDETRRMERV